MDEMNEGKDSMQISDVFLRYNYLIERKHYVSVVDRVENLGEKQECSLSVLYSRNNLP